MNKIKYSIFFLFFLNSAYSQIKYDSIKVFNHFEIMGYTTGAAESQLIYLYSNKTELLRFTDNQTDSVNLILKKSKMKKLRLRKNSSSIFFITGYKGGISHLGWITFFNDKVLLVDCTDNKDYWILYPNDIYYLERLIRYYSQTFL